MSIRSLREKWRQRRFDLAINQIQNPAEVFDDDGLVNGTPMPIRSERAMLGSLGRMTKAKSRTEWRGD